MCTPSSSEQFSLRWNNFHHNLATGFHELLAGEALVDVTLACGGQLLQAHKLVLAVCSPYFRRLFAHVECRHPLVVVAGVQAADLKRVLQFMYRGEVRVLREQLATFLHTAELLQVKGLTSNTSHVDEEGSDVPSHNSDIEHNFTDFENITFENPQKNDEYMLDEKRCFIINNNNKKQKFDSFYDQNYENETSMTVCDVNDIPNDDDNDHDGENEDRESQMRYEPEHFENLTITGSKQGKRRSKERINESKRKLSDTGCRTNEKKGRISDTQRDSIEQTQVFTDVMYRTEAKIKTSESRLKSNDSRTKLSELSCIEPETQISESNYEEENDPRLMENDTRGKISELKLKTSEVKLKSTEKAKSIEPKGKYIEPKEKFNERRGQLSDSRSNIHETSFYQNESRPLEIEPRILQNSAEDYEARGIQHIDITNAVVQNFFDNNFDQLRGVQNNYDELVEDISDVLDTRVVQKNEPLEFDNMDAPKMDASQNVDAGRRTKRAPYTCETCSRTFSRRDHLRTHVRNLHGAQAGPLACRVCAQLYKNTESLRKHVAKFHCRTARVAPEKLE